jgi:hypothetical protein
MSTASISGKSASQITLARKLWMAFRFVVFGVGGFVLLWISTIALSLEFSSPAEHWISPYFALPLAFAAALMMLFGAGEWGRWAYLLVFVSTPVVLFLLFIIPLPKWVDDSLNKGSFVLVLVLPFILTYIGVRHYYRRRDARNNSTEHKEVIVPAPEEQISK